ncbi:MAG: DUF6629 family protein [Bacteroidota bacterium]
MCFSLEASIAGGIVVSSIGVAAVKKIHVPAQTTFASIPLVFGIQQFSEGLVWYSLSNPANANLEQYGTYIFLFVARILWPVLMPLSVLLMEEDPKRKQILRVMFGLGAAVAIYYSYCLLFMNVYPQIDRHHIQYISDFPQSLADVVFFIYVVAAIPPLFVSSIKRSRLLGILMLLACIVTGVFYIEYLTSVWCFFAAVVSVVILWIVNDKSVMNKT